MPSVLYLKGRALDMRVDEQRLSVDQRLEFRADRPSTASRETWQAIAKAFPTSETAATAMHRLAMLEAMDGAFDQAIARLDTLLMQFEPYPVSNAYRSTSSDGAVAAVFERADTSEALGIRVDTIIASARKMQELLIATRDDAGAPISTVFGPREDGSDPMVRPGQLLMTFDPSHPAYPANLKGLIRRFPDSAASDFARVRIALLDRAISRRVQRLRDACKRMEARTAGAEAAYYLGDALQEDHLLPEAMQAFKDLTTTFPQSCWARDARERMAALNILMQTPS